MLKQWVIFGLLSTLLMCSVGYAQQSTASNNVGDALNVLLGAYNGAATAMAENQGTQPQLLRKQDVAPLMNLVAQYEPKLQSIVNADGSVNATKFAELLNQVQQDQNGTLDYDFVRAARAVTGAQGEVNLQALLHPNTASQLIGAAKGQALHQQLEQAAPYIGMMMQMSQMLQQQPHPNSVALNTQVDALKALAAQQFQSPSMDSSAQAVLARLKVIFANRMLHESDPQSISSAKAALYQLAESSGETPINVEIYGEIRKLLKLLGSDFTDELHYLESQRTIGLSKKNAL